MRCLGCRYSLKGLPAGPCPECGRVFDRADAGTFDDGSPRDAGPEAIGNWPVALLGLISVLLATYVLLLKLGWVGDSGSPDRDMAAALTAGPLALLLLLIYLPLAALPAFRHRSAVWIICAWIVIGFAYYLSGSDR